MWVGGGGLAWICMPYSDEREIFTASLIHTKREILTASLLQTKRAILAASLIQTKRVMVMVMFMCIGMDMHACMHMHMHMHTHTSTFPPKWAMGHPRHLRRSWKVMDGHERSWSWAWAWSWACPCPYPWNGHTHMRVQTQRKTLACKSEFQPGFCFKDSHFSNSRQKQIDH